MRFWGEWFLAFRWNNMDERLSFEVARDYGV